MRAPGMTWFRMPLFVWALYATALMQVLATPVLGITLLLIIIERTLHGIGIFDPALGGDPVLFQHFFWFYSHPAVYIMILPGFGIISELITVHSRKPSSATSFIASRRSPSRSSRSWCGATTCSCRVSPSWPASCSRPDLRGRHPTAIKVFSWIATLYKGSIRLQHADVVRAGLPVDLHGRRPDRPLPRCRPVASTCTSTTPTSWSRTSTTS
jgi:cytochrome c oxidase subunit 1